MLKYVLKRILMLIPVLIGVTFIVYFILALTPGDPVTIILGDQATEQSKQELREELGLDQPLLKRYVDYMGGLLQGDMGKSYKNNLDVADQIIKEAVYNNYVIKQNLVEKLKGPSAGHIFGQDEFGRDVFLRIIWGTRYSLLLGVGATIMSALIGGAVGSIAGFYGKKLDNLLMRLMDVLLSIPSILLSIAIVAALGTNMFNVMLAIAISYVPQ